MTEWLVPIALAAMPTIVPIALALMVAAFLFGAFTRHPAPHWTVVGIGMALAFSHAAGWWM